MEKRRVLYLISRENILEPGVLKSQALDLAGKIVKSDADTKITVLNLPSINRFFKYFRNYSAVKKYAWNMGVKLVIIPIFPIGRSLMPVWATPFFVLQTVPLVTFFILRHHINIIHARSYLSALTALIVKRFIGRIRVAFDTRSLYLQEAKTYGSWVESNLNYKFWKGLEQKMFENSDEVVVQASKTVDYVKKTSPKASVSLIPSPVDADKFKMSVRDRLNGRRKLGIADDFVFVYSGRLGGYHDPEFLAKFYSAVRRYVKRPHFLVATYSDPAPFMRSLKNLDIGDREVTVLNNPPLEKILPLADAGFHIYDDIPIAPYASSVKMPEYASSGLPVIVTPNMVSVADLVRDNRFGVVVDPYDPKDIRSKMQKLVKERETFKKNALKLAREYFSVGVCAAKYIKIYDELIKTG